MKEKSMPMVSFSTCTKIFKMSSKNINSIMTTEENNTDIDLDFGSMLYTNTDLDETGFSKTQNDFTSPSEIEKNELHFGWSKKNTKNYPTTPFIPKSDYENSLSNTIIVKKKTSKKYAVTPFNRQLDYDPSIYSKSSSNSDKENNESANSKLENDQYMSEMEKTILNSSSPISINEKESESIEVFGERGVLANKQEIDNWISKGVPLNEYKLNYDTNPRIIRKKVDRKINYIQDIAIRYLRPNTPSPPGKNASLVVFNLFNSNSLSLKVKL